MMEEKIKTENISTSTEFKGKARSENNVPAGPNAGEYPEGFTRTYVTRWEKARWAHTHKHAHMNTHTGHSG